MTDDDDLRARLRGADPAAGLSPLPPGTIDRLMEETMSRTEEKTGVPVLLVAAAAVVLVVVGVAGWLLVRPGDSTDTLTAAGPAAEIITITATGVRAKCVEPTAATLAERADFAFAGTVTEVTGDVVSVRVSEVFRGAAAGQVEIAQTSGASEQLLGSGGFETGREYLVSSSEGAMLICGYSGEAATPGLREMFETAF
ncbi:hypothetical protein ACIA8K_23590 [Catenuloplanes sp. NPDC051500]|uniref:hypothetical protein n=1 Tax=Catenuloplanes sp. NPDC051500 TaxID=3363959 RepID=UPI0037A1E81C